MARPAKPAVAERGMCSCHLPQPSPHATFPQALRRQRPRWALPLQILPTSRHPLRLPCVRIRPRSACKRITDSPLDRSGEASKIDKAYSELSTCKALLFALAKAGDDERERLLAEWIATQDGRYDTGSPEAYSESSKEPAAKRPKHFNPVKLDEAHDVHDVRDPFSARRVLLTQLYSPSPPFVS